MNTTAARTTTAKPVFLTPNGHRLFALQIVPTGETSGAVLYLPPFAEEMNRCRSHVVAQARAMAERGLHCLILDPFGTGESEGEIIDARWELWLDDARAAAHWLAQETGFAPTVWGVRTGALLAAELATSEGAPALERLLFWQPVLDGKLFLNQLLRLRLAAQMFNHTEKETTDQLRTRLSAGEVIEVAGYPLGGAMADSLATRKMSDFTALSKTRIAWVEVVTKPGQALALPSRKLIDTLTEAGGRIDVQSVACPMIWQLHERADAPEPAQRPQPQIGRASCRERV